MHSAQALSDLIEISSQVEVAVLFHLSGGTAVSTLADADRAEPLAEAAKRLLDAGEGARGALAERPLTQLEVATRSGSVFVVREGDRAIAATTGPEPTVGLVFYDLKSALRGIEENGESRSGTDAAA